MGGLKQMMHSATSLQQIIEEEEEDDDDRFSDDTSFTGESSGSLCCSNSIVTDDACSSSSAGSLESEMEKKDGLETNGPLYELSSLIAQLPIRCVLFSLMTVFKFCWCVCTKWEERRKTKPLMNY